MEPITRKEMFLAKAGGQSVTSLEPITREEMFLQRIAENSGGTGGGGSASIDVTASVGQTIVVKEVDANGKPTKWEAADYQPRTHWTEKTEILPPTTPAFDEETDAFVAEVSFEFLAGNTYVVNWNGTPYTCVAAELDGVVAVGNLGAISGAGDSGEPFFMAVIPGEGILSFAALDGSASVTLSIAEVKNTPIPVQYVTNAFPYCIELTTEYHDDGAIKSLTCAESSQMILNLYRSGRSIVLKRRCYQTDSSIEWWIYHLAGVSQLENETTSLVFTSIIQTYNGSIMPSINIIITADGQMSIEAMHHS